MDLSGTLAEVANKRMVGRSRATQDHQTLKEAGGNRNRAAELLQVSYKTLLAKLKDYGMTG